MTFTAFEYPKMAFLSKVGPSGTKKSKRNIKIIFENVWPLKLKMNYALAFLAFIEVKMWF